MILAVLYAFNAVSHCLLSNADWPVRVDLYALTSRRVDGSAERSSECSREDNFSAWEIALVRRLAI